MATNCWIIVYLTRRFQQPVLVNYSCIPTVKWRVCLISDKSFLCSNQCIYYLYKGVRINICCICLLVPCVLCRAKCNKRWSNTDHVVDTYWKFNQYVFAFLWLNLTFFFLHTWGCSILFVGNIKLFVLKRNRKNSSTEDYFSSCF